MKKISIIAPCYNEKDNIQIFYEKIKKIFENDLKNYSLELIIVDNNSTDGSIDILKNISKSDKDLKIILNKMNYGLWKSTFNAINYAKGDALIPMLPIDMQDPPELIVDFIKEWENGFEVVYGIKKERNENFFLKSSRNIYYKLVSKISDIDIPPYVGEFQLIDKKIYKELLNFDDYYPYTRGLISTLSTNKIGINYTWQKRTKGKSKMNLFKMFDVGINGIISFSNFPIRIFSIFGFILAIGSFLYMFIPIFTYFFLPERNVGAGISTIIVAIFFFSGVQLLFLGIVGEYIAAIHRQVRKPKKNVIVKELINCDKDQD
tara:strand:- start:144 stop:1100 length:957 start_codon:yes stop_codon:yes gene_type:complete